MAKLSKTGAPTFRWYVAEQGVIIPNISETLQSTVYLQATPTFSMYNATVDFLVDRLKLFWKKLRY